MCCEQAAQRYKPNVWARTVILAEEWFRLKTKYEVSQQILLYACFSRTQTYNSLIYSYIPIP